MSHIDAGTTAPRGHFQVSWKRMTVACTLFVAIVLVVDQGLDYLLRLGVPADYRVFVDSRKVFDADKSSYDGLILGDSFTADALDPAGIAAVADVSLFNHGVYNSSMGDQRLILEDKLNDGWRPKLVVIGLGPLLFIRDDVPGRFGLDFIQSPVLRAQAIWSGVVAGDLAIPFASGRDRAMLPGLVRVALGRELAAGRGLDIGRVEAGYIENRYGMSGTAETLVSDGALFRDQIGAFPAPRPAQVAYLNQTVQIAQAVGARVVLVIPPVSPPQVMATADIPYMVAFMQMARDTARRFDVPLIQGFDPAVVNQFSPRQYFDAEHMCAEAARLFSTIVGQALVADGVVAAASASNDGAPMPAPVCHPRP